MADDAPILRVEGLRTWFHTAAGPAKVVDGVDLELHAGRTTALVGESGCGKSVTALSIPRLVPCPPGIAAGGRVLFRGDDLVTASEARLRSVRGNDIAMVFQEPMTSLNPVLPIGEQIAEVTRLHQGLGRRDARDRAIEMLGRVGIADPAIRVDDYPHHLSGGMRQRVMIAMALSCDPAVLVADEPTTALDVTVQAQILDLLEELQAENGTSILFITHDLGVVAEIADRVAVMYAGRVVEDADATAFFARPRHPYGAGLLRARPDPTRRVGRLAVVAGVVPAPLDLPSGCRFRNRCPLADRRCAEEQPPLRNLAEGRRVACHAVEEGRDPPPEPQGEVRP